VITEISRTDRTKRKDVLIRAFAKVQVRHPDTLLVVSVDENEEKLYRELWDLIAELGITSHVAVVGNIWEWLPDLYGITSVYCSPSVMEGFGMAVQEAAATSVPIVGSHLIPFVTEYLLNGSSQELTCEDSATPLKIGPGAIVVQADDIDGFACAIDKLLTDEDTRVKMGEEAYKITIPYFTWDGMVRQFLEDVKFGEIARTQYAPEGRFHLDRRGLLDLLDTERIESLSVAKLEELFRAEEQISKFLPDGVSRVDPRDGAVVVFNAARAKRPHDNAEPPAAPLEDGSGDPICRGDTTRVVDVAPLSEGFTFVNKNLFPAVFPTENLPNSEGNAGPPPRGMHFLQWTSSYFDRDWHNMPQSDRVIAMARLAALEEKLLVDETSEYPESGQTVDGKTTRGYVLMMKNHGRAVGGSLAHGHQQIVFSNHKPRHFERNERYAQEHGETFAEMMLRENPEELLVKDYGPAVLMVPYFMKRPYNMLLILKDHRKSHLFECDQQEVTALARAWGEVTLAYEAIMPSIDKPTAYNITISNGPGAGLYCEFLPYTQETGGLEHLGFWVCQDNPAQAADRLRHFVKSTLNGEGADVGGMDGMADS
jgi:galactose-1-phosphate uridylyltransferase